MPTIAIPVGSTQFTGTGLGEAFNGPNEGVFNFFGKKVGIAFKGANTADVVLTGQALTLQVSSTVSPTIRPAAGTLTVVGRAPVLDSPAFKSPAAASLAVTGHFTSTAYPTFTVGGATFAGAAPTLAFTPFFHYAPAEAALSLSGQAPVALVLPGTTRMVRVGAAAPSFSGTVLTLFERKNPAIPDTGTRFIGQPVYPSIKAIPLLQRIEIDRGFGWEDISSDVVLTFRTTHYRGMDDNRPLSLMANSGELRFRVRNDAFRPGKLQGRYTFGHTNCLAGWTMGTKVRVVWHQFTDTVMWTGKVADVSADLELHGRQQAEVVAYDYAHDLIETDIRQVAAQINQTGPQIFQAIFNALPASARPLSTTYDTGIDVYPIALDRLGEFDKAAGPIGDVLRSSYDMGFFTTTGGFKHVNRETRLLAAPIATLNDGDFTYDGGFDSRSSRDSIWNVIYGTYHPKRFASTTIWSWSSSTPQLIYPGQTIPITVAFRDNTQLDRLIGAYPVTTPVAGVDYVGNTLANGTGLDQTGNISISMTPYVSTADMLVTNNGSVDVYLTTWQLRGVGIFDEGNPKLSSSSTQPYGSRSLDLDFTYQPSPVTTQGIIDLVRAERETLIQQPNEIKFWADSAAHITLARTAEIGNKITLNKNGFPSRVVQIHRIEVENIEGNYLVHFGVGPISTTVTSAPSAPLNLNVTNASDTQLLVTWMNTDALSATEVYRDGVRVALIPAGISQWLNSGLTRATTYTYTLKHLKYSLIRSVTTGSIGKRPRVEMTGGTLYIPGDGNEYHIYTLSDFVNISKGGRISSWIMGGGAGGGWSSRVTHGGGGGGAGAAILTIDNIEPVGNWPLLIGAGGLGGRVAGQNQAQQGTESSYRGTVIVAEGGGYGGSFYNSSINGEGGGQGACGGGGAGEGGNRGEGDIAGWGGFGSNNGSDNRPGGGGGGMTSNGVSGDDFATFGGAGGTPIAAFGNWFCAGGQGGGLTGAHGENATFYGNGGNGTIDISGISAGSDGGNGYQGWAVVWFPI